ncbi:hypothetical protein MA16_Dca020544 [Dendrobium catenatum]|uniref:Uncharacterized protein n=1 Tax=Dendrobium catenatum TaxID=906689 RepID=A0A2I0W9X2_9ASPA|nr:hypothetical protein MA16_Dca020544 [Dendrobium catenatum]
MNNRKPIHLSQSLGTNLKNSNFTHTLSIYLLSLSAFSLSPSLVESLGNLPLLPEV